MDVLGFTKKEEVTIEGVGTILKFKETDNYIVYNDDAVKILNKNDTLIGVYTHENFKKQFWKKPTSESIVPDNITKCRVVALQYNNTLIAYRFKTDVGSFDVYSDVAHSYGLDKSKVSKCIKLLHKDNIFMTNSEYETGKFVPDISDNEVDCRRVINAYKIQNFL